MAKYNLLRYTAAHADVHLGQELGASLTPAIILWEHGHLTRDIEEGGEEECKIKGVRGCIKVK